MRLSSATAALLPDDVERFGYDRAAVKTGVVHLGIGAFHRAHQAVVFDDALRAGDLRWGITAIDDPLSSIIQDRLASADNPVAALLSIDAIFPPALAANARFIAALEHHVETLTTHGVDVALKGLANGVEQNHDHANAPPAG